MSDDKKNIGKPDRDRINTSEDYEVQDWSKKFGVSPEELKKAVKQVGSIAKDVEAYLKNRKSPTPTLAGICAELDSGLHQ